MATPPETPTSGQTPPGPSLLDLLAERFQFGPRWTEALVYGLLLLAVSAVAGSFLFPGLYSQQIPMLGLEHLGTPFRAASVAGFKAGRDYEIPHHAMTGRRREEARAAVRPVYDLAPRMVGGIRQSVLEAFKAMRERLSAEEQAAAAAAAAAEVAAAAEGRKVRTAQLASRVTRELAPLQVEFERVLFGGQQELKLEPEDFKVLHTARFSEEVQQATLALVDRAYGWSEPRPVYVAGSREELSREGAQGIVVRDVEHRSEQLLPGTAPGVLDTREVQAELDRYASIPGNILPESPVVQRRAVLRLAKRLVRSNLTINISETDERRRQAAASVKDEIISIKKGQRIIGDGELVNEVHLVVLQGMRAQTDRLDLLRLQVGGTGVTALLIAAGYLFCRAAFRRFRPSRKDLVFMGLLLVSLLWLLQGWVSISDAVHDRYPAVSLEALAYAFPLAAGAMLVRFVLAQELALFFAVVLACLAGVMQGNSLAYGIYALVGGLVAAERIGHARDRVGIFKAGLVTGAANLLTSLFLLLAEGKELGGETLLTALFAFAGTTLTVPLAVVALTPLIESVFGYASDLKLLDLANLNHPALKELIVQAPGTYHHSIIIGTLVEHAAEAIGANPLLARSCAYYHDIGKGRNPLYFGENQKGEDKHESIAPAMSAVILKRHVTEGLEMARQYKLPGLVADAIAQHHGTRLVGYFHHKALKELEGKEGGLPLDESVFRYPGPKPQFREAALVMLADAVESAYRAHPEPSPARRQAQVQRTVHTIFAEGQLDECELTSKDLSLVVHSFVEALERLYPPRLEEEAPGSEAGGEGAQRLRGAAWP